jgi:hypothetical protein
MSKLAVLFGCASSSNLMTFSHNCSLQQSIVATAAIGALFEQACEALTIRVPAHAVCREHNIPEAAVVAAAAAALSLDALRCQAALLFNRSLLLAVSTISPSLRPCSVHCCGSPIVIALLRRLITRFLYCLCNSNSYVHKQ